MAIPMMHSVDLHQHIAGCAAKTTHKNHPAVRQLILQPACHRPTCRTKYSDSTRFPQTGSGGRTACAGPFYHYRADLKSDRKLPAADDGRQFLFDWERGWILTARTDEPGGVPRLEPFALEVKLKRPIEMELGPDDALYVIEFGTGWENNKDAQIVRIEPL